MLALLLCMEDEGNNVDFFPSYFHGSSYQLWRQMWVHDIIKKTVNVNVSASKSATVTSPVPFLRSCEIFNSNRSEQLKSTPSYSR